MEKERLESTITTTEPVLFQSFRPARYGSRVWLHVFLFVLTCITTFFMGLSDGLPGAFAYSGGIMTILLTHEFGHYLMARKYGVPVTLPYFIPMPLPPISMP